MSINTHALMDEDFNAICLEAGALEACRWHPDAMINQQKPDAERRAYAIATNRWKAGTVEDHRVVMDGVKEALESADSYCVQCRNLRDA